MADEETIETEEEESGGKAMGFLDHLEDLRWTMIKSVLVFGAFVTLIAYFLTDAAYVLKWPLLEAAKSYPELSSGLITTSPMAVFTVIVQVCLLGGFVLSLPFVLFFIGQFVAPALTKKERRIVLPGALTAMFLFLSGAVFSYFFIVPAAIKVSMELNTDLGYQNLWSADRYYSMLVWLVLGLGATFEFPLVIVILVYLRIIDSKKLIRSWRMVVVIIFIVAAVVTPTPDPITQTLVATPMLLLYVISVFVARGIEKRRAAEELQEEAE